MAVEPKLLEVKHRPRGTVHTVWRTSSGARRSIVLPPAAFNEGDLSRIHAHLKAQEAPK